MPLPLGQTPLGTEMYSAAETDALVEGAYRTLQEYMVNNDSPSRELDVDNATTHTVAVVLATLIEDLKTKNIVN